MKKAFVIIVLFAMVSSGLVFAEKNPEDIIREKLETTRITFEFDSTPITEVVKLLIQKSGINMIIEPRAIEHGAEKYDISLKVENMKLKTALNWIMQFSNLDYDIRDELIYIAPEKYLVGDAVLRVYYIKDLITPIITFPGCLGASFVDGEEIIPEDTPSPESIEAILRSIDSETGWGEGTCVQIDQGDLIITQRLYMHEKIEATLEMLRKKTKLKLLLKADLFIWKNL